MNILGIDTTTKNASCTIFKENNFYTKCISNEITHSEKLLPIIHETLFMNDLNLDDISLLAAINGPGSFTGIRIGLATIKAFAQVKGQDIFSISSIDLISYVAFKKAKTKTAYVLSLIDARNNRVYYGINKLCIDEDGKIEIEKIVDVGNDLIDDVISSIKNYDNLIIAGNCVDEFKDKLSSLSKKLIDLYPTTEDLISCYLDLKDTTNYMYNAYSLDALYARPSQAERMANNNG